MESWSNDTSLPMGYKPPNFVRVEATTSQGNNYSDTIAQNNDSYLSGSLSQRSAAFTPGVIGRPPNQLHRPNTTSPRHRQLGSTFFFPEREGAMPTWEHSSNNIFSSPANSFSASPGILASRSSTSIGIAGGRTSPALDIQRMQRTQLMHPHPSDREYDEVRVQQAKLLREKEIDREHFHMTETARLEQQRRQVMQQQGIFPDSLQQQLESKQYLEHRHRQQMLVRREEERIKNEHARAIAGRGLVPYMMNPPHPSMPPLHQDGDAVDAARYRQMRIEAQQQYEFDQHSFQQQQMAYRRVSPREEIRVRSLHRPHSVGTMQSHLINPQIGGTKPYEPVEPFSVRSMQSQYVSGLTELEQHRRRQLQNLMQRQAAQTPKKNVLSFAGMEQDRRLNPMQHLQQAQYYEGTHPGLPPLKDQRLVTPKFVMGSRPAANTPASVSQMPHSRFEKEGVSYEYNVRPNSLVLHTNIENDSKTIDSDRVTFSACQEDPIFPFSERTVRNSVTSLEEISKENSIFFPAKNENSKVQIPFNENQEIASKKNFAKNDEEENLNFMVRADAKFQSANENGDSTKAEIFNPYQSTGSLSSTWRSDASPPPGFQTEISANSAQKNANSADNMISDAANILSSLSLSREIWSEVRNVENKIEPNKAEQGPISPYSEPGNQNMSPFVL